MGPSSGAKNSLKSVSVFKDDLCGLPWLELILFTDSEHLTKILACWTCVFTSSNMWLSNQGIYFKNEVLAHLARVHHIKHYLTVACSPWCYGTVEALTNFYPAVPRAILEELKLSPSDCTRFISAVATALYSASLDLLGAHDGGITRTSLKVMTGIRPTFYNLKVVPFVTSVIKAKSILFACVTQVAHFKRPQMDLNKLHNSISQRGDQGRARAIV